ncbi:uncharacterized protein LOC114355652 [Ostrinia furnacalis]|uniref:uncharacterized protein LOC114355652 n=1 Tax=Ostrinia furnacalis TaxID=93504 RepID=UPI00103F3940|nr:uncharacterized protein LOC114355652 [Ostrinia furnacalis]
MSGRTSPVNGGYEAANAEPAMRLTVRKDLFPEARLPKIAPDDPDAASTEEDLDTVSYVKLETDFEQSIDDIANQKQKLVNGLVQSPKPRHRKHKQHSRRDNEYSVHNGCLPSKRKRRKNSSRESRHKSHSSNSVMRSKVKGGKNLNLVSSSECQEDEDWAEKEAEESESSEDEVLRCSVKLPLINLPRQSGKPYSHELSQLSTKKSKKDSKERRTHAVTPCSGKPRSMLDICSSRSKKKSKKSECTPTYRSQIVDMNTIKIKIKRTNINETKLQITTPTPTSIADLGQRKSKKKRAASPAPSESSGEEYDPKGDNTASMSVAPKAKQARPKTPKTRKSNNSKKKSEKTERTSRISAAESKDAGPQSPWATMPEEVLVKIFEYAVASQGTLPSVIRFGRVCKLWHIVSCRPELWKSVDLAQYTKEKCKTDYKLVWLLENRLSQCQSLNIAQWKVCNLSWVLACVADYCPALVELSVAGWSRMTPEQLFELVQGLPQLQRLDLSLTSETGGSSTCLSAASMARLAEAFGARFTHLTLANNKYTALPQILSSVAAHCSNLEVLDISGALATSHPAAVPVEALQKGCPKLRVFRAANSQLVLAPATTSQQMEAVGWTQLEELSIAGEAAAEAVGVGEYRFNDDALSRLVRAATRLRLLDLRGLQRLTDSGLVRVPAWDLQHLFLGGCNVTRQSNACLELICEKWSHSLLELDLSWASAARVLDDAVSALADSPNSKLRILNLCGSSVSLEPVKKVLLRCPHIESINLSSCRALPRGMKRLYTGKELQDLKDSLDPEKAKTKENESKEKTKKNTNKTEADSKTAAERTPKQEVSDSSGDKSEAKPQEKSSDSLFQEPKSVSEPGSHRQTLTDAGRKTSPDSKTDTSSNKTPENRASMSDTKRVKGDTTPKLLSPMAQLRPDSSSTPRSEQTKGDMGSPHFSPVPKPDSQVQNSPEVHPESIKSNSWSLGQFKTTPTHKSEASPLNRIESHNKLKHGKFIEQCSPTTSLDNKPSPETLGVKQDIKTPNSWSYGSPMPRQEAQFASQRSPYSAQPSPAQPSPYSTQPSPYSTQPSPYSSQPSPYSAQPSPDTSQIVKPELPKAGAWNTGGYSPMPKHHAPFSPHPSTHASPDAGPGAKDPRGPGRTPGQYSPMSRQDRLHPGPYSPRPDAYTKRSPGVAGGYSPMLRADCQLASPDQPPRPPRADYRAAKAPELAPAPPDVAWGMDRFGQLPGAPPTSIESLVWGAGFEQAPAREPAPAPLSTPPQWGGLPGFEAGARRAADPWALGHFRVEPPTPSQHTFVEQSVSFDALSGHVGHAAHALSSFLDEAFAESSRVD